MNQKVLQCLMVAALLTIVSSSQAFFCDYDHYSVTYNKTYQPGSEAYKTHKAIFEDNCAKINSHNADPNTNYKLGINHLTDLTDQELPNHGYTARLENETNLRLASVRVTSTPPTELNYTALNMTSPVQDQGYCGSCVPFAVVGMYESVLLMKNHSFGLSEQANLECVNRYLISGWPNGCHGGYPQDGLNVMVQQGGLRRSTWPYTSYYGTSTNPGICDDLNRIYAGPGSGVVYNSLTRLQLQYLLHTEGPVTVAIDAGRYSFSNYRSGVYEGCGSTTYRSYLDHLILLTGYSDAGGFWILKNSWGTDWGQQGYMHLSYERDCGITLEVGNIKFTAFYSDPTDNSSVLVDPITNTTDDTTDTNTTTDTTNTTDNTNTTIDDTNTTTDDTNTTIDDTTDTTNTTTNDTNTTTDTTNTTTDIVDITTDTTSTTNSSSQGGTSFWLYILIAAGVIVLILIITIIAMVARAKSTNPAKTPVLSSTNFSEYEVGDQPRGKPSVQRAQIFPSHPSGSSIRSQSFE